MSTTVRNQRSSPRQGFVLSQDELLFGSADEC